MFFSDRSDFSDESDWSAIRCYHFMTRLSLNGDTVKLQPRCGKALTALRLRLNRTAIRYSTANNRNGNEKTPLRNTLIIKELRIIANLTNFGRRQRFFRIIEAFGGVCKQ
jgi:hypothetical protein